MKSVEQIHTEIAGISDQILTICNNSQAQGRDLSNAECASIATFESAQLQLRMQAKNYESMELRKPEIEAKLDAHIAKAGGGTTVGRVPARAIAKSQTTFSSNQDAYDTGKWIQAIFGGDANAYDHCRRIGTIRNAMTKTRVGWKLPISQAFMNETIAKKKTMPAAARTARSLSTGTS